MIYRCPSCNGALEYNPVTDEMECAHCGNGYTMQEMEAGKQKELDYSYEKTIDSLQEKAEESYTENESENGMGGYDIYADRETMECKIYTCTSCGAELAVSDTEVSTYCAYCGQPTIVYSRVSQELKPDYILPFKITREQAIDKIRKRIKKGGILTPKAVKNFEIEKVRGIYIPYFLFDLHYRNNQKFICGGNKESKYTIGYWLTAECEFVGLSCDASSRLEDESSQRLEPFGLRDLKEFNAGYLSGFYAERYDMSPEQLSNTLHQRCQDLYMSKVKSELGLQQSDYVNIRVNHPYYNIHKAKYALLPVWFLTFRYKNEPYTILLNGQTGKIVGAIPYDKTKVFLLYLIIAVVLSIFFYLVSLNETFTYIIFMFLFSIGFVGSMILHLFGALMISNYNKNIKLTRLKQTAKFVRERQESDEWKY